MRFSLYLTLRLNILCAAPVFYHSIYLKSIWSILCAYDSKLECILECMANECMLNANWPCSTCLLIQLTFRTQCFRVQRVSMQFIIFASCLNCPSLHRNIQRFGICHSEILNQNLSHFPIIPSYFS